jgi:hypothetical protein
MSYKPFGEDWEREMMKWEKKDLVSLIRNHLIRSTKRNEENFLLPKSEYTEDLYEGYLDIKEGSKIYFRKKDKIE